MTRWLTIILLLAASLAFGQGWQWQNPRLCGNEFRSIGSIGDATVWACSRAGDLLWSTDSGQAWSLRGGMAAPRDKVIFLDETHGWGITAQPGFSDTGQARIFFSSDGGFTWSAAYTFPHLEEMHLFDLDFVDAEHGWAVGYQCSTAGYSGVAMRTTDGGQTWSNQSPDSISPRVVSFISPQEGWMGEWTNSPLYHTTDGGDSWSVIQTASPAWRRLKFLDANHAWASGLLDVFHSTDGGLTWLPQHLDGAGDLECLSDSVVSVAVGNRIFETHDAGAHWTMQLLDSAASMEVVHYADAQRRWIAGNNGLIRYTSDDGSTWSTRNGQNSWTSPLVAVDFADRLHGWAGTQGYYTGYDMLLHTDNGGQSWVVQDTSSGAHDIAAADSLDVWVCTNADALRHTTDGGTTWTSVLPCPGFAGACLARRGHDYLWAVGHSTQSYDISDSVLCRSTDNGASWSCFPFDGIPGGVSIRMAFADDLNGWRVTQGEEGNWSNILHTSDGGQTWENQHGEGTGGLESISPVDAQHCWMAGNYGGVIRTTDGGATWNDLLTPYRCCMTGVQFFDTLNGWAFTRAGYSFRSSDGGFTWQAIPLDVTVQTWAMKFVDLDHGWVVGDRGSILHFDGTASASKPHATPVPQHFSLSAYPNPFNPTTVLAFDVPANGRVALSIYDLTGRLVQTLTDQMYAQGSYRIEFDGSRLPSGIYFARLQGNSFSKTQKLVLLK